MTQPVVITRRDQLTISGVVFREFTALLVNMDFPVEHGKAKAKLQFTEMNVIQTLAPYLHPTAELSFNRFGKDNKTLSDRAPWGRLLISADEQGYPDIIELKGHTLHLLAEEQIIEADPEKNQTAGSFITWSILTVDGTDNRAVPEAPAQVPATAPPAGGAVTEANLIDLIHGKTIGEFTTAAINLAGLPAALRGRLLDANDLVPSWVNGGIVTTDGNTYTKV